MKVKIVRTPMIIAAEQCLRKAYDHETFSCAFLLKKIMKSSLNRKLKKIATNHLICWPSMLLSQINNVGTQFFFVTAR